MDYYDLNRFIRLQSTMLVFERKVPLKPIVKIFQTIKLFWIRQSCNAPLHNESKEYRGEVHQ